MRAQLRSGSNAAAQSRRRKSRQRQSSKLGEDGKRTELKKKEESLAGLPTLTPLHSQHSPSSSLSTSAKRHPNTPHCQRWSQQQLLPTALTASILGSCGHAAMWGRWAGTHRHKVGIDVV